MQLKYQQIVVQQIKKAQQFFRQNKGIADIFIIKSNLNEIHFNLYPPQTSVFKGSILHGKIIFSSDYPYSCADVQFINENGKFNTELPICLSYHEDKQSWSSSIGIQGLLLSVWSLFEDNSIKGTSIINDIDFEYVKKCQEKQKGFHCNKCGCTISE